VRENLNEKVLSPEKINELIVPRLIEQVEKSNGRLKGYFLWPQFRIGGKVQLRENGKPIRCHEYKHVPGNTPIIVGGVEIGYMLINLQWMRPEAWRGLGAIIGVP
jgi:hypothetical protein